MLGKAIVLVLANMVMNSMPPNIATGFLKSKKRIKNMVNINAVSKVIAIFVKIKIFIEFRPVIV